MHIPPLNVCARNAEGIATLVMSGVINRATVSDVRASVQRVTRADSASTLVLDLWGVEMIDADAIVLLIQLRKSFAPMAITVVLKPGSQPDRVLRMSGLERILRLHRGPSLDIQDKHVDPKPGESYEHGR